MAVLLWLWACGIPFAAAAEEASAQAEPPEIDRAAQDWWRETREELFDGIELSAEQQAGVDAVVAEAARDRARARELKQIADAPDGAASDQQKRARVELRALRGKLDSDRRIDAMRELLGEDQRVVFDRNRRLRSDRLFAELKRRERRAAERRRANTANPK